MPHLATFDGHRRIEHQAPAVERRIRHQRLDHLFVVADAVGAPHVDHAVGIARDRACATLRHELRIHVLQVRQLRFVERQIDAGLDLPLEVRGGGHHDVEAAAAREQLGLQRFVGVEVGDVHLDAGLLLEIRQGVRRQVVGPDVEIEDLAGAGGPGRGAGIGAGRRLSAAASAQGQRAPKRQNRHPTNAEHHTLPLVFARASYIAAATSPADIEPAALRRSSSRCSRSQELMTCAKVSYSASLTAV